MQKSLIMECSTIQQNVTTLYRIYKMENLDKFLSVCLRVVGLTGPSGFLWVIGISVMDNFIPTLTPVAASIIFGLQFVGFFLTNEFSETKNTSSASLISKQNKFAFLKWSWGQLLPHSSTFPTRFLSWLDEENVEICPFLKTREQNFVRNLDSNLIYRW